MYRWRNDITLNARVSRFEAAIAKMKSAGVPIAFTVHNLAPHDFPNDPLDHRAYQFAVDHASVIHHHCAHSQQLFSKRYHVQGETVEVIAAHGNYLSYPEGLPRTEARRSLGISGDAFVFLQFGQIRGYKGLGTLLQGFSEAKIHQKHLLIAGQFTPQTGLDGVRQRLQLAIKKRVSANLTLIGNAIPSDDVQTYLNACDCLVMTHSAGLNSGVAVLGMTFGKVVIGPRLGCIEWVLQQGSNVLYEAGDVTGLRRAMEDTAAMSSHARTSAGNTNRNVAAGWHWDSIVKAILEPLQAAGALSRQPLRV